MRISPAVEFDPFTCSACGPLKSVMLFAVGIRRKYEQAGVSSLAKRWTRRARVGVRLLPGVCSFDRDAVVEIGTD